MLNIFNDLMPFIEDCYKEFGVREYSRLMKISPPTASTLLKSYEEEGLLKMKKERGYFLFRANRENDVLKGLSKIYWKERLKELLVYLNSELYYPPVILFGSLTKLETKEDSDIDLVLFTKFKKKLNLEIYEKQLKRKIQIFKFNSLSEIKNKELKTNIINGYILQGELI